jgi:hypothetical protein
MRWWVVSGAAIVVLGAAAGVAIAVNPTEDVSPHETLARAREFVADAESVEYTQRTRLADDYAVESREQVRFPDRMRAEVSSDFFVAEVVIIGDDVYGRQAEKARQLPRQDWVHESLDDGPDPNFIVSDPATEGPDWIGRLLRAGSHPRFAGRTDGTETLVVDLPLDLLGEQSVPFDPEDETEPPDRATATITLDARAAPRRIVVRTHGGDVRFSLRTTIGRWNGPVRIAVPAKEDIDATPEIDEAAIERFRGADPIVPAAIPRGWEQTFAGVSDEEWNDAPCDQLNFTYEDPERFDQEGYSYLDVYVHGPACHEDEPLRSQPFAAGPRQGWIALEADGWAYGEIAVGESVVSFDTDLAPGEVAQILAELVPFDPTRPPPATLPIGAAL